MSLEVNFVSSLHPTCIDREPSTALRVEKERSGRRARSCDV